MASKVANILYQYDQSNTSRIMLFVMVATLPGIMTQWYFFGFGNLIQIALAVSSAFIFEASVLIIRKRAILPIVTDNSAILTGLLLGISTPPLSPWWLVILGAFTAIVFAKQLYGGLGHNIFNPSMVGYVVMLICFPEPMTSWLPSHSLQAVTIDFFDTLNIIFTMHTSDGYTTNQLLLNAGNIARVTPFDIMTSSLHKQYDIQQIYSIPMFKEFLLTGWFWQNIAFLVGGTILLWKRIITWHIPISFLLILSIVSFIAWIINPHYYTMPLIHLFYGATMLGAFFIMTDPVTSSATPVGKLIFGGLIAILSWIIRSFGEYPDAIAFAVLLANITVPVLDHFTQPLIYGLRK